MFIEYFYARDYFKSFTQTTSFHCSQELSEVYSYSLHFINNEIKF